MSGADNFLNRTNKRSAVFCVAYGAGRVGKRRKTLRRVFAVQRTNHEQGLQHSSLREGTAFGKPFRKARGIDAFAGKLWLKLRIPRHAKGADGIASDVENEQFHGCTGCMVTTVVPGAVVGSGAGVGVGDGFGVVNAGKGVGVSASFGVGLTFAVSSKNL